MSEICDSSPCLAREVGPFMAGITEECAELGNCQLPDIMQVVANVGNFVFGLVGVLVLLMYVYGGVMFLIARGNMDYVKRGKDAMVKATIGLVIVFGAFAGITALKSALTGSAPTGSGAVDCSAPNSEGRTCALNSSCKGGACVSECVQLDTQNEGYACVNVSNMTEAERTQRACFAGACPGGTDIICCKP